MSVPRKTKGSEPDVYARLSEEQERRFTAPAPPRWARPTGWLLVAATAAGVVVAVLEVRPW